MFAPVSKGNMPVGTMTIGKANLENPRDLQRRLQKQGLKQDDDTEIIVMKKFKVRKKTTPFRTLSTIFRKIKYHIILER